MSRYDIKTVDKWVAPSVDDDQVKVISMPNVPKPLHSQAPRTILGSSTWERMRKRCYYNAKYKCEACGCEPEKGHLHSHELYSYDYINYTAKFERCVALCSRCHTEPGVHTGRALTMLRNNNVLMPPGKLLEGLESLFKLVYEYNTQRKPVAEDDLRLYAALIEYTKNDRIGEQVDKLIDKYKIKFYSSPPNGEGWGKWKLIIGNKEYPCKFNSASEWEEAMAVNNAAKQIPPREKTEEDLAVERMFAELGLG